VARAINGTGRFDHDSAWSEEAWPRHMQATTRAIEALSEPSGWPLDRVAEILERGGIDQPRVRDVLFAYFEAMGARP
jgi:hypothetical protein